MKIQLNILEYLKILDIERDWISNSITSFRQIPEGTIPPKYTLQNTWVEVPNPTEVLYKDISQKLSKLSEL